MSNQIVAIDTTNMSTNTTLINRHTNIFNLLRDREIRRLNPDFSTVISNCACLYENITDSIMEIDREVRMLPLLFSYKINAQEPSIIEQIITPIAATGSQCLQLQKHGIEYLDNDALKKTFVNLFNHVKIIEEINQILIDRKQSKHSFGAYFKKIHHDSREKFQINRHGSRETSKQVIQDVLQLLFEKKFLEKLEPIISSSVKIKKSDSVITSLNSYIYLCEEKEKNILQFATNNPVTYIDFVKSFMKEAKEAIQEKKIVLAFLAVCTSVIVFQYLSRE